MQRPSLLQSSLLLSLIAVLSLLATADAADTTPQALTAKLLWRNVGPYIGGRVVAVAGVPGENNLFYMGAVDG
ncbi:MAG TPA: hypothetical protein VGT99_12295, partial [Gammaproteobacteria bacterium]|nr:hypothetical protein [Gammaproteobacteria bacterium]